MKAIPAAFWQSLDVEDFTAICDRGYLNKAECARLWKIAGWTDPIPDAVTPMFARKDILRFSRRNQKLVVKRY